MGARSFCFFGDSFYKFIIWVVFVPWSVGLSVFFTIENGPSLDRTCYEYG